MSDEPVVASSLEWHTAGDPRLLGALAGPWRLRVGGGEDVFRVRAPAGFTAGAAGPAPGADPGALWAHITGPARVETLHADRVIAETRIDAGGDLITRTVADAPAELLALHAEALAAVLDLRAAGVAAALDGLADVASLAPALRAWCTDRLHAQG
ncbi:MAG: hypothetical protein JNL82_14745 [Myxococcales bacterium]|nr:hypothetical protein [Myxococcales bacterium]